MPNLSRGSFSLNFGLAKFTGELEELDRQCAWEFYTELATRVAVTGKFGDDDCSSFEGELLIESLESLYKFFQESRSIMRKFPVGRIGTKKDHLGILINKILAKVLRPFLEKWHVKFRHWWEHESNPRLFPIERQKAFPEFESFIDDWKAVRYLMREVQKELIKIYKLVDLETNK